MLLRLRLIEGLRVDELSAAGQREANRASIEGLLIPAQLAGGRAVLTLQGRLLADGLALRLLD